MSTLEVAAAVNIMTIGTARMFLTNNAVKTTNRLREKVMIKYLGNVSGKKFIMYRSIVSTMKIEAETSTSLRYL